MMRRRRMKQTTGGDRAMGTAVWDLALTWRRIIKDTNQSETPEASPTPLPLSSHNLPPPVFPPPYLLFSSVSCFLPSAHLSLSLLSPAIHHFDLALLILLPLLLLPPARLLSLFPSAAVSRPRHPTLPSAADINQPLRGKQREGRRERERWKKREKASRQPVIRTNVDGLRIAGREEHNAFACLFTFFNICLSWLQLKKDCVEFISGLLSWTWVRPVRLNAT